MIMRKGVRLIKRLVALSLALLLSIESFAAVVGDNDGAAFITKAEFDSLKSTFQAQIDRYNQSIDNKIDGAIASYLAGVGVEKTVKYKTNVKNLSYPLKIVDHYKEFQEVTDDVLNTSDNTKNYNQPSLWQPTTYFYAVRVRKDMAELSLVGSEFTSNTNNCYYGVRDGNDFVITEEGNMPTKTDLMYGVIDNYQSNGYDAVSIFRLDMKKSYTSSNGLSTRNYDWDQSGVVNPSYTDCWFSNESRVEYPPQIGYGNSTDYTNFSITPKGMTGLDVLNVKWSDGGSSFYYGKDHMAAYTTSLTTSSYTEPVCRTILDTIWNNESDANLALVGYTNNGVKGVWYTNKKKNRKLLLKSNEGVLNKAVKWSGRSIGENPAKQCVSAFITSGENLESENENSTRAWYNKSLIRQNRLKYKVTFDSGNTIMHRMNQGVPLINLKDETIADIAKFVVNLDISSKVPTNKKYIVFSYNPIILNDYSADVDSDENYLKIKNANGITFISDTRKIELKDGSNKIELSDIDNSKMLFCKILWQTTTVKDGANYDDEYVTFESPTFDITSK